MKRRFRGWVVRVLIACALIGALSMSSLAQGWNFNEEFNGGFNKTWVSSAGSLPTESLVPFRSRNVVYRGGVFFTFEDLDGTQVIRLNEQNPPEWSRFGYISQEFVSGSLGTLEARINTLAQGGANIDGLFDLWLINRIDHSKYVRVGLFGDISDTIRSWCFSSSQEQFQMVLFPYLSDTWYRVRIRQQSTGNLEVSVWNDAGTTKLTSYTFGHTLQALGSEFQVGFSQWMGGTNFTNSMLVAVDYIRAVASLSGRITLQGAINQVQPVTFEFRPTDGSPVFQRTVTLNADRTFVISALPPKNYHVWIKGERWLARVLDVDVTAGDASGVNVTLRGGDGNNDNSVDILDLDLLIQAFDSNPNSPNWDQKADLNADDGVDVQDLDLLIFNFDRAGDA